MQWIWGSTVHLQGRGDVIRATGGIPAGVGSSIQARSRSWLGWSSRNLATHCSQFADTRVTDRVAGQIHGLDGSLTSLWGQFNFKLLSAIGRAGPPRAGMTAELPLKYPGTIRYPEVTHEKE